MPTILSGPATSRLSASTCPLVGGRSPEHSFMKVDLPQPLGPTMAMKSCSRIESETSSIAFPPASS